MIKVFSDEREGFTLIELLIGMVLTSIIVTMVVSLFFFGRQSFTITQNQYELQSEMRLMMDAVLKEIRYASDMEIISNDEASNESMHEEGYSYFYIRDGKLYNDRYDQTSGTYSKVTYDAQIKEHASMFTKEGAGLLRIDLLGEYEKNEYSLNTQIELPNLMLDSENEIEETLSSLEYPALKYSINTNE